jgi:hypothetical protein
MRLLCNLCGWEVKLAKERAGWVEDEGAGDNSVSAVRSLEDYVSGERKAQKRKDGEEVGAGTGEDVDLTVPRDGGTQVEREVPALIDCFPALRRRSSCASVLGFSFLFCLS